MGGKKDGQGKEKVKQKSKISRTARAGLQIAVGRTHTNLKNKVAKRLRVGATAAVYAASTLEYLIAEVLELAGNAMKDFKVKRITPRHLLLAIRGDDELDELIRAIIPGGGVVPHIHRLLQNKNGSN
ncbi:histone H2A.V-like [Anopheles nili]|uniref:histone H2A.V-like n=1 Tax=Anopheles nili TaxID=185578 RepID=UPI00237A5037|nr:histone H2A.V-like [Anopheles nili]